MVVVVGFCGFNARRAVRCWVWTPSDDELNVLQVVANSEQRVVKWSGVVDNDKYANKRPWPVNWQPLSQNPSNAVPTPSINM